MVDEYGRPTSGDEIVVVSAPLGLIENFEKVDFSKSLRRTLLRFPSEIALMQSSL